MVYKVLLADDSLTIQKLVEMALSDSDFNLLAVSDGQEAINALADFQPDIILADTIMPQKDGYQVCEFVKSDPRYRHTPVILLTGRFQPYDKDRAEAVSVDTTVSKPFSQNQLVQEMRRLLANRPEPVQAAAPAAQAEEETYDETATIQVSSEDLRAQLFSSRPQDQPAAAEAPPQVPVPSQDDESGEENYMELATEDLEEVDETPDLEQTGPVQSAAVGDDALPELEDSGDDLAITEAGLPELGGDEDDSDAFQLIDDGDDELPESLNLDDTDEIESFIQTPGAKKGADTQPINHKQEGEDTQPVETKVSPDATDEFQLDLEEEAMSGGGDDLVNLEGATLAAEEADPPVSDFYELPEPMDEYEHDDENDTTFELETPTEDEEEAEELLSEDLEPEMAALDSSEDDLDPLDLGEAIDDTGEPLTEAKAEDQEDPLVAELDDDIDDEAKTRPSSVQKGKKISDTDTLPTSKPSIEGLEDRLEAEDAADQEVELELELDPEPEPELNFDMSPEPEQPAAQETPEPVFDMPPEPEQPAAQEAPEPEPEPEPVVVQSTPEPILVTPEAIVGDESPTAGGGGRSGSLMLSEDQLAELADMVSARIIKSLGNDQVREVVWQVIPELAEAMIKKRIYQLEQSVQDS